MGPLPTGLDGGQWLALGRGLFGDGRSTAGAYPPLVPLLTELIGSLTTPGTTLKLIAIGSLLATLVSIYLVARDRLGPWLGLAVVATIGPASAVTEPVAFGGYPQQLAFAFLLLATWVLARFLDSGRLTWLIAAGIGLAGAALTHHIYFPLALGASGLIWLLWLRTRPGPTDRNRRTLGVLAVAAVSLACFAPTAIAFVTASYVPPLDTSGLDPWSAVQYGTREATWIWLAIAIAS
nr:glycosyltransferase family 39 protein [Chloroflexia bacterium]